MGTVTFPPPTPLPCLVPRQRQHSMVGGARPKRCDAIVPAPTVTGWPHGPARRSKGLARHQDGGRALAHPPPGRAASVWLPAALAVCLWCQEGGQRLEEVPTARRVSPSLLLIWLHLGAWGSQRRAGLLGGCSCS